MKKLVLAVFAAAILFAGAAIAEETKATEQPKAASSKSSAKVKGFKGEIISIDTEKCEITV